MDEKPQEVDSEDQEAMLADMREARLRELDRDWAVVEQVAVGARPEHVLLRYDESGVHGTAVGRLLTIDVHLHPTGGVQIPAWHFVSDFVEQCGRVLRAFLAASGKLSGPPVGASSSVRVAVVIDGKDSDGQCRPRIS